MEHVITAQMLAASKESSWQVHMPVTQPTPVRKIAQFLHVTHPDRYGPAEVPQELPTQPTTDTGHEIMLDPALQALDDAQCARGSPIASLRPMHARLLAHDEDSAEEEDVPAAGHRGNLRAALEADRDDNVVRQPPATMRQQLRSSAAAFLVEHAPIVPEMSLPQLAVRIEPAWTVPKEMLQPEGSSAREGQLVATLRTAEAVISVQREALVYVHA